MLPEDQITILGITGYTGAWLAQTLTAAGYANIVGTYRDADKMTVLQQRLPNLTGVKADLLTSPDQVALAVKGSRWVFNNAAPFTGQEATMADYVTTKTTAINHLMHAIYRAGTVQKVVHLGSAAAIYMGIADPTQPVIDEDTWADVNHMHDHYEPFIDMKVAEERRLRDLAQIQDLDVAVLHPTNIVGPSLMDWQHDMIYAYLHGNGPLVDGPLDCIDVRDVAGMELAMMNDVTGADRVLGLGFTSTYHDLEDTVQRNFEVADWRRLFDDLPQLVESDLALQLWRPFAQTSFYQDQAWRLNPQSILRTKYPNLYHYQYTDATATFIAAVQKMLVS